MGLNDILSPVVEKLQGAVPGLMGVYLFGSRADGSAGPQSDYDIAFLTDKPGRITAEQRFYLSLELADIAHATVDLVDLHAIHTDFRFIIISSGKRIFYKDVFVCDSFEMTTYSMYQYFEEGRRLIIADIKKRGSVYARQHHNQ